MKRSKLPPAALVAVLALLLPQTAYAHGFGQRYDLPVPLALYLSGAGAAVALSFVVIGVFVRGAPGSHGYPRLNLLRWRAGRALVHPGVVVPIKVASVAMLALVAIAGLAGTQTPTRNVAPTMVWVLWWVGIAFVSALAGNVWQVLNPWKAVFEWAEALYRRLDPEGELSLHRPYPAAWGMWPGVLLFAAFAWVELVYERSAVPARIAQLALLYSLVTWTGMVVFGKEVWLRRGEAFSIVFGFLARFAPTELRVTDSAVCDACSADCRDLDGACTGCGDCFHRAAPDQRELNLRPYAVGLLRNEAVSASTMVFVVLVLSTVTFDGFTATPAWSSIFTSLYGVFPSLAGVGTLGLAAFPALFIGVYLAFAWMMSAVSGGSLSAGSMAKAFVFTLVPIALAYHLAHYLTFLLIQGQYILPLASDPLGRGWDLFGTAAWRVNIAIVDARFAWFTAVAAIVAGHIVAVHLAHVIALRVLRDRGTAMRSQYPLLGLMVGYTVVSLWILAQPIVEVASRG